MDLMLNPAGLAAIVIGAGIVLLGIGSVVIRTRSAEQEGLEGRDSAAHRDRSPPADRRSHLALIRLPALSSPCHAIRMTVITA